MKKYLMGSFALLLAVGFTAFTEVKQTKYDFTLKQQSFESSVNSVVFDPGVPGDVDPTFGVGEEQ